MLNKADEAFVNALIEENRKQREIIRELMRQQVQADKYWAEFALKLVEKGAAA